VPKSAKNTKNVKNAKKSLFPKTSKTGPENSKCVATFRSASGPIQTSHLLRKRAQNILKKGQKVPKTRKKC
jgi:hypothetical protein